MKRTLSLLLVYCLLLSGCGGTSQPTVLVYIEETEGCTVLDNGQRIIPGADVTFTLELDHGLSLDSTDYPGRSLTSAQGQNTTLTLRNVTRPTRVKLSFSRSYAQITYHANGGYGLHTLADSVTQNHSLGLRTRPNTDTGTDTFAREGYVLLCWNTSSDGTGDRVGLGSRVSVPTGQLDLYAQWVAWSRETAFTYAENETGVTVTGYAGTEETIVVPERLAGKEVTAIAAGAFRSCAAQALVLPKSVDVVEHGAFQGCRFRSVTLYDNIQAIPDDAFRDCPNLHTLYINAIEAPFGYAYRKESCYADKVDMLINAQGRKKLVFYGGCSMWYNLDGFMALEQLGSDYVLINMGLNGTVNSAVQMMILGTLLQEGDVLFHTPELSSRQQLMTNMDMLDTDKSLWCGIENNYDLFTLVDLQTVGGVFSSLCAYLDRKDQRTTYGQQYTDDLQQTYLDPIGGIPFLRSLTEPVLGDKVYLDPGRIDPDSMARLERFYDWYQNRGVTIYLSHACINLDAVPQDQRDNVAAVDAAFRSAIEAMDGPVLVSDLSDFLYYNEDFYDTNYHLLSHQARRNTSLWLRDLTAQMEADGLWSPPAEPSQPPEEPGTTGPDYPLHPRPDGEELP